VTVRISLVKALPNLHWAKEPLDWHLDLAFLKYLWEHGEDTILETAFYEPFKPEGPFDKLKSWYTKTAGK